MKKTFIFFLFFIIHFSFLSAQSHTIDSLYRTLKTAKGDTEEVQTLNRLSYALYKTGDYSRSDSLAKKSLQISENLGFKNGEAEAYNNIGNICKDQGNYPEALRYLLQSLRIAEQTGTKSLMSNAYGNIGIVYHKQGSYADALKNELKSLELDKELGDKTGIGASYVNIGNIYKDMGNYAEALDYNQLALTLFDSIGSKYGTGIAYVNIGLIYYLQNKYEDALKNQLMALSIFRAIDNKNGISDVYNNIGNIYMDQKKYAVAKKYTDSALILAKKIGEKDYIRTAYGALYALDTISGDYKTAYNDYQMYITYRDSIDNEQNTKKIVSEQMQYEFEKQQAAAKAEQDKKDAIAAQERKKQLIIRNAFIVGFVLVLALAFFIFRGYRQKQKANRIITIQKELVEEKQKEIVDSIHYAERIQKALLASDDLLKDNLPEYFVFYKPKDIVSGDFYWATRKEDRFYLAVCDSTGHGVPGAFMSLLNISFLNEAINEKGIGEPNKVLDHTRKRLIENISQEGGQDGMDGILVTIKPSKEGTELRYAAAYNGPVVIRNKELMELEEDKMPVGKSPREDEPFRLYKKDLHKGDAVYLFTDGYADQFGGPKEKKYKYRQMMGKLLAISDKPMKEQGEILGKEFMTWMGELEQTDDVLFIGIRV